MLFGSLVFVGLGLWMAGAFGGSPVPFKIQVWGWVGVLLFGLCALMIIPRLTDIDDQVRISSIGIYSKHWSDQTIPWSEITDVSVWKFRQQKSLTLRLADPSRFPSTTMLGKFGRANRALTGGDVVISLAGTDGRFDDALAAIRHFGGRLTDLAR